MKKNSIIYFLTQIMLFPFFILEQQMEEGKDEK